MALAAMCCLGASAQEKLFNSASVQSPVVNKDGTVTFNLFAPKAVKVEVTGDFLPTQPIQIEGYGTYDAPGVAQLKEVFFPFSSFLIVFKCSNFLFRAKLQKIIQTAKFLLSFFQLVKMVIYVLETIITFPSLTSGRASSINSLIVPSDSA